MEQSKNVDLKIDSYCDFFFTSFGPVAFHALGVITITGVNLCNVKEVLLPIHGSTGKDYHVLPFDFASDTIRVDLSQFPDKFVKNFAYFLVLSDGIGGWLPVGPLLFVDELIQNEIGG